MHKCSLASHRIWTPLCFLPYLDYNSSFQEDKGAPQWSHAERLQCFLGIFSNVKNILQPSSIRHVIHAHMIICGVWAHDMTKSSLKQLQAHQLFEAYSDAVWVCWDEERSECESEAVNLPFDLFLPSPIVTRRDWKDGIIHSSSRNELPPKVSGFSLRDRERSFNS